jgi:hypothetical protein
VLTCSNGHPVPSDAGFCGIGGVRLTAGQAATADDVTPLLMAPLVEPTTAMPTTAMPPVLSKHHNAAHDNAAATKRPGALTQEVLFGGK